MSLLENKEFSLFFSRGHKIEYSSSNNHILFQLAYFVDPAAGGSIDYTYGVSGIKYSFGLELRGPGFDPPKEMIEPGWREFWAGVLAMIKEIETMEI